MMVIASESDANIETSIKTQLEEITKRVPVVVFEAGTSL
jgi:hypothetical protein